MYWIRTARRIMFVAVIVMGCCLSAAVVAENKEASTKTGMESMAIVPQSRVEIPMQEFSATVIRSDESSVAGAPVKVWDLNKKTFVWKSKSDEEGVVQVPALSEGSYLFVVGDRIAIPAVVAEDAPDLSDDVQFLLPRGKSSFADMTDEEQEAVLAQFQPGDATKAGQRYSAGQEDEEKAGWLPGWTTSPEFLIGAGAVTVAGGTLALISGSDSGGSVIVSPPN